MVHNEVEIDPVLHALGPLGRFPVSQCFLFFLGYLADAHQLFIYVFIGQDVDHTCAAPKGNESEALAVPHLPSDLLNSTDVITYKECVISAARNHSGYITIKEFPCIFGMEYDAPRDRSIVSEFDLVCGRMPLAGLTQTILSLGAGFGSIILPWLSDLYGRKRIMVISEVIVIALTVGAGMSPDYVTFAVLKFFLGIFLCGIGLIGVTAGVELFPSSHRALTSGMGSTLFWVLAVAILAPIAYLLRFQSWRTFQIALSGSSGVVLFIVLFAKEPIRWLVANGKYEEAEDALLHACKWNGKDPESILQLFRELVHSHPTANHSGTHPTANHSESHPTANHAASHHVSFLQPTYAETNGAAKTKALNGAASVSGSEHLGSRDHVEEELKFLDLVCQPLLRKNALVSWFMWFTDSLIYNALYLMSGTLALDIYTSFFINASVEGASCVFMVYMLNRLGRKPTLGIFHAIAGVCLITSGICSYFTSFQMVGTVASFVGKMGIGGAFNVMFMYTPEIFPTNIRNRALGTSLCVSTAGGMIAPFSDVLAQQAVWAPGVLFGTLSLLAVLCLFFLPESKGRELPQNIRDLEAWYDVTSSTSDETGIANNGSTKNCDEKSSKVV